MLPWECGTGGESAGLRARLTEAGNRPRPPPAGVAGFSSTESPLAEGLMYAANYAASLTRFAGRSLVTAWVEPPQFAEAWPPAVHCGIWVIAHRWAEPAGR